MLLQPSWRFAFFLFKCCFFSIYVLVDDRIFEWSWQMKLAQTVWCSTKMRNMESTMFSPIVLKFCVFRCALLRNDRIFNWSWTMTFAEKQRAVPHRCNTWDNVISVLLSWMSVFFVQMSGCWVYVWSLTKCLSEVGRWNLFKYSKTFHTNTNHGNIMF
jgi:hypothetical protein